MHTIKHHDMPCNSIYYLIRTLATMPEDRFPKQLLGQEWDQKPRRGRQRRTWGRVIDDLFVSLGLDKAEWLEDIERGESSLAS